MINYADYEFYKKNYKGCLSDDLFDSLIIKASREIDKNINCDLTESIINSLSNTDKYKLKYTACELCDFFNTNGFNSSKEKVNSISIDGVSINKNVKSESEINNHKRNIISNLPDKLTWYL